MIEFQNLDSIVPEGWFSGLQEGTVQALVENIATAARDFWVKTASDELLTSRQTYVDGIQELVLEPGKATITLVGQVPNLIENGQDAYDMHDTLLGDNVPVVPRGQRGKHPVNDSPGRYYRAIPFRHQTPGPKPSGSQKGATVGVVGMPMGRAFSKMLGEDGAEALGQAVYRKARRLKPTTSQPGEGVSYGGRFKAKKLDIPLLKPHHKTNIYEGMVRQQKTYAKTTQSQYTTFRTISTGSPGWRRGATEGKKYVEKVSSYVQRVAPATFEAYVKGLSQ